MVFIYSSGADQVIDVNITQGIGDRIYNTIADVLNESVGALTVSEDALVESNERLQKEIERIDDQVEQFRLSLLRKFSSLEAAISKVNNILQTLDAQQQAIAANG